MVLFSHGRNFLKAGNVGENAEITPSQKFPSLQYLVVKAEKLSSWVGIISLKLSYRAGIITWKLSSRAGIVSWKLELSSQASIESLFI